LPYAFTQQWQCSVDLAEASWDNPTMTTKADSKKRVVLPSAQPGDVYEIQKQGEGRFLLVRLERPQSGGKMSREDCLRAMASNPLRLTMDWEHLKKLTREP